MFRSILTKGAGTLAGAAATALGQPQLAPFAAMAASQLADKGITLLANHKFSFKGKKLSPRDVIRKAKKFYSKAELLSKGITSEPPQPAQARPSHLDSVTNTWNKNLSGWRADDQWRRIIFGASSTDFDAEPEAFLREIKELQDYALKQIVSNTPEFEKLYQEYGGAGMPDDVYQEMRNENNQKNPELMSIGDEVMMYEYPEMKPVESQEDFNNLVAYIYKKARG